MIMCTENRVLQVMQLTKILMKKFSEIYFKVNINKLHWNCSIYSIIGKFKQIIASLLCTFMYLS